MTKVAIVGLGNVGRGVLSAIGRNQDMILTEIVTRRPDNLEINNVSRETGCRIIKLDELKNPPFGMDADVAILCGGSAKDLPVQGPFFARGISTVDSYDTHAKIPYYWAKMNAAAFESKNVSVISAGWDPGTFSLERTLGDAFFPGSENYTFWGEAEKGGVSQGHSDAIRKITGVKDARQYTIPKTEALELVRLGTNPKLTTREKHSRLAFVVLKDDNEKERARVTRAIVEMPNYFSDYDTEVRFIDEKTMKAEHSAFPHGGFVLTSGETGDGNKTIIEYRNQWASNPEATGSILVACARAAHRLKSEGRFGAFTMLDIPPAYFSHRSHKELLEKFT